MGVLLETGLDINMRSFSGCFSLSAGTNFRMTKQIWSGQWVLRGSCLTLFETPGKIPRLVTSYVGHSSPFRAKRWAANSCSVPPTFTRTQLLVHILSLSLFVWFWCSLLSPTQFTEELRIHSCLLDPYLLYLLKNIQQNLKPRRHSQGAPLLRCWRSAKRSASSSHWCFLLVLFLPVIIWLFGHFYAWVGISSIL